MGSHQAAASDRAYQGTRSQDGAMPTPSSQPAATQRIQLWDWPLRLFHWSLLAAIGTAIVTGTLGGQWMHLHGQAGVAIAGLLAFRITWGLIGSSTARFAHFVPTPGQILAYVRGRWQGIGHNPLGALSVLALLALLGSQLMTGLFSNDDIAFAGPLASLVDEAMVHKLTSWHHQLVNALYVLLGLHVAAIAFHVRIMKDNIVQPMVTGWKDVPADLPPPRRARPTALLLAVAIGLLSAYGASGQWKEPPAPSASPSATTTRAPSW